MAKTPKEGDNSGRRERDVRENADIAREYGKPNIGRILDDKADKMRDERTRDHDHKRNKR